MDYLQTDLHREFSRAFAGKRVFVTGHTGFKGSWLCEWLLACGARVRGYALEPSTDPSLFGQLGLAGRMEHQVADVRDAGTLREALLGFEPDFVFHLAAQPLVVASYAEPRRTFETNVTGTLNLLEAMRGLLRPCIGILVTSDKCYRNDGDGRPFAEDDALGGGDPYSASKGAMEILAHSYRKSFFRAGPVRLATVRAGNVIGGGDYAADRIVPDCVRALRAGAPVAVRNPAHTRPWQHVLEPLSGYLWLADRLAAGWEDPEDLYAFNFGPVGEGHRSVRDLVEAVLRLWPGEWTTPALAGAPAESHLLALSVRRARELLGWRPRWDFAETVRQTVEWYRASGPLAAGDAGSFTRLTESTIRAFAQSRASGAAGAGPDRREDLRAAKEDVLKSARRYARLAHSGETHWAGGGRQPFRPGEDTVPYAGRVYNDEEISRAVDVTLDFWLTLGKEGDALERELAQFIGVRRSILVNSGSSANLLAVSALTSHKLPARKRLRPGDEVITCAAGFPTTVAPILQNGLVPVFIDNDPATLNPRMEQLEAAYREGRTKAVMFAHAMGSPFDLSAVLAFCRRHDLWLIEDNCDALGARYSYTDESGAARSALTGSFGDLSTQSFYPPHHLTMGEGGAVNVVSDMKLKLLVESFRDWGRDCWCPSGKDNTCNKRFGWQLGELPEGYDHKYIYSHLGYNLKPLDIQAAIGRVQLGRVPGFIQARRDNWQYLRAGLDGLSGCFGFSLPVHASGWSARDGFLWPDGESRRSEPSWFGFMMRVLPQAGFTRPELCRFLERARIGNRVMFGGNLVRQPALVQLRKDNPDAFRAVGDLAGADEIMQQAVFVGVYPGLGRNMLDYIIDQLHLFCKPYV